MATKIAPLTKTEFFDVYGVSLILSKKTDTATRLFLVDILAPVAQKYLAITKHATTAELRYFLSGGCKWDVDDADLPDRKKYNRKLLKKLGVTNWAKGRKTLSFDLIEQLFWDGEWEEGVYGGPAWGEIARAGCILEKQLPVTEGNLLKVISAIDRLNDLEHNCNLYLDQYSTFDLEGSLEFKLDAEADAVIQRCSKEIRDIYKELI